MIQQLFAGTTIPILEQVVRFTQARHHVLAGNLANMDTPGYQVRDLSVGEFQRYLRQAIAERHGSPAPGAEISPGERAYMDHLGRAETTPAFGNHPVLKAQPVKDPRLVVYHDLTNTSLEQQVIEMVKNHMLHNTALAIMTHQFRQLQTAISEHL